MRGGDVVPIDETLEHVRAEGCRRGDRDAGHAARGLMRIGRPVGPSQAKPERLRVRGRLVARASARGRAGAVREAASMIAHEFRIKPLSEDEPGAQLPERLAARVRLRAVDDQRPVEVIELVLDDTRVGAFELERHGLAVRPSRRPSPSRRAPPALGPARASTSCSTSVSLPMAVTTGFTSTRSSPSSVQTKNRRRMPTCVAARRRPRVVHEPDHPLGDPAKLVVPLVDLRGAHAQDRSPYCRICASATSRRMSRSASARASASVSSFSCSSCSWSGWSCS